MATHPDLFYRPSGKFPTHAPVAVLGIGLVTGLIGGAVYGMIDWWVPFIYILFIATLGLGVGQAFVLGWALKTNKVRNTMFGVACGAGFGLFAYYGAWVGWIWAGSEMDLLIFNPVEIVDIAVNVNETGTWGLFSENAVSGLFLLVFWVVEAGVIIVPSIIAGLVCCDKPFNEKVNAWADEIEVLPELSPISTQTQAQVSQGLAQGDFSVLQNLTPLRQETSTFTSISFAWAAEDKDTQFMSIDAVSVSTDKDGNLQVRKSPVTQHMIVDAESRALIEEIFAEPVGASSDEGGPTYDAEDEADAEALSEMDEG